MTALARDTQLGYRLAYYSLVLLFPCTPRPPASAPCFGQPGDPLSSFRAGVPVSPVATASFIEPTHFWRVLRVLHGFCVFIPAATSNTTVNVLAPTFFFFLPRFCKYI